MDVDEFLDKIKLILEEASQNLTGEEMSELLDGVENAINDIDYED